jgi:hypothetical protein
MRQGRSPDLLEAGVLLEARARLSEHQIAAPVHVELSARKAAIPLRELHHPLALADESNVAAAGDASTDENWGVRLIVLQQLAALRAVEADAAPPHTFLAGRHGAESTATRRCARNRRALTCRPTAPVDRP